MNLAKTTSQWISKISSSLCCTASTGLFCFVLFEMGKLRFQEIFWFKTPSFCTVWQKGRLSLGLTFSGSLHHLPPFLTCNGLTGSFLSRHYDSPSWKLDSTWIIRHVTTVPLPAALGSQLCQKPVGPWHVPDDSSLHVASLKPYVCVLCDQGHYIEWLVKGVGTQTQRWSSFTEPQHQRKKGLEVPWW